MSRWHNRVPHWDDCPSWDSTPFWHGRRRHHFHDETPPDEEVRLFSLVASDPANGAVDVRSGRFTVTLTFDENVVNNGAWAHNRHRIRMWAGTFRIPIRVTHNGKKVFVTPINGLPANSKITVAVAPDFMSSSGHILGKTAIIIFSTAKFSSTVRITRRRLIAAVEE
ncbi:MAG TPA: Ig-like domain-containing protein [Syntrophomonadaceae bacterium]|nr:Ig-like domain-containing protein [Syntrophomonadaceae bacterium]HQA06947.1 Ig-like domain-containing protein [Syntrophomonadaceae bacterium]HQE23159.1 Ig-like domain-containing protein [Syntrophomonadaceae bacterium]